jgi:uncharacterized tellurite resistance protein B-like protein
MDKKTKTKQLLKILIGAAWIDGMVQPEERQFLLKMAKDHGIADDPEIKPLLFELKDVKPAECYAWLESYLGNSPSQTDYQELFVAMSALIYSDGDVHTEEAKLLIRLESLDPAKEEDVSTFEKILRTIQKLYRQSIDF